MGDQPPSDEEACASLCGAFDEFRGVPNNCLKGVHWSPDGTCLLTASEDQQLRLFELPAELADTGAAASLVHAELGSSVRVAEGDSIYDYCWYPLMHSAEPASCCFASASRDHPIHLWDAYTGGLRASYSAYNHLDEVTSAFSLAVDPAGARLYAGSDRTIRIFDLGRPGRQCEVRPTSKTKRARDGQRGIISCLACAPDRCGLFAAGSYAGTTGLYVDNAPTMVSLLGGHSGGVTQVRWSHDGLRLFTGARRDGDILCYDVRQSDQPLARFARACVSNQRIGFDLSADSRALVSASQDGRVLVYDVLQPERPPAVWLTYADAVNGATLHPFSPLLAVAVGERRFPLAHGGGDEEGEEGEAGEEDEAEEARGENGLQVWAVPRQQPADAGAPGNGAVADRAAMAREEDADEVAEQDVAL